ncbi:hypothetical protein vBKpnAMK2_00051 [Klebsiella phage vB_Kpn_AM_K2]
MKTEKSLKYYVYMILINKNVVYIGKGTGDRAWSHFKEALKYKNDDSSENAKCEAILEAERCGYEVEVVKIKENLTEHQAFSLEAFYIDCYWGSEFLTNKVKGLSEKKRCNVKFSLDEAATEHHYNAYIRTQTGLFGDSKKASDETSNMLTFAGAKRLIEESEILAIHKHGLLCDAYNLCVIESIEVIRLLDLIGVDVTSIFFISQVKEKCEYISEHFGCFIRFNFLETKMRKFNTIIMNPPFKHDSKFIKKALEVSNNVVCITPASYLHSAGINAHKPEFKPRLERAIIDDNNGDKYFNAGMMTQLAISKFTKNETPSFVLENGKTGAKYTYNNDDFVSIVLNNTIAKNIANKVKTDARLETTKNSNNYIVFNRKLSVNTNGKILMGPDYYKGMVNGNTAINVGNPKNECTVFFNSSEEAENAIKFYSLPVIKLVCTYNAGLGGGAGKRMIKHAPVVDFTKEWTREMVQEHFNISDEEWEYAENVVNGVSIDEIR